ncbi:MAG TPA: GAF domain-containing protein [Candidatus Nanopelagicales bacterium]|nr:GAF domain-containing protein [Candidatus Nanopelagicales bacterium]
MSAGTSEHDLSRFFAVCPDLLCVLGRGGAILRWNAAWETVLGHGAGMIEDLSLLDLVHPADAEATREAIGMLLVRGEEPEARTRLEGRFRTRSGAYVRLAWSLLGVPEEGVIYGAARNVDRERRVERALMQRIEAKMAIASICSRFIEAELQDIDHGFDEALEEIGRTLTADRCALMVIAEDGRSLVDLRAWSRDDLPPPSRDRAARGEELAWLLERLQALEVVSVPDVAALPDEERVALERRGIRGFLRVPAVYGGRLVGVVGLDMVRAPRAWDESARSLLTAVGEMLAITLQRKRAEEALRLVLADDEELRDVIRMQGQEIQTLSTPIIQVWDGVLALPIVGGVDGRRAADIMEKLLHQIVETQSRFAILELTGVEEIDADTARHLAKMLRSIELLGARGVVAGVRPLVAQMLASLDVVLPSFSVQQSLAHALRWCMARQREELPRRA